MFRPVLTLPFFLTAAVAAEPARVDFSRDIRPILTEHCGACHGADEKTREAELRLDVRENALARKAIVPKNIGESRLVRRIETRDSKKVMPPESFGKPLSERQKQLLKAWISDGAEYAQHWAFTPPRRADAPAGVNPIDHFVRERLKAEKLSPAPEADRATLIRRVTLDLTGLPPTPPEVEAFLADRSPDAYEKVVDRLLKTPAYAERMAMAWLDAARYADTNGFNNDEDRTQWPWRDWLIRAFEANMPFDRFVIEQLAGDQLPNPTLDQRVATAFLRNQVHNTEGGIIPEEYRVEYVADRVHTTATIFLGLSMQCARCHDHKYDPLTMKDYYQFFGFFNHVSDKQANYSSFVAAEPFIRVPSAEQREKIAALERRRQVVEKQIREREANLDSMIMAWEQGLTPEEIRKIAGAGRILRVPLDEKSGPAVATSHPAVKGNVRGNAKWVAGKAGNAFEFDGQSWLDLGAVPVDPDGPFSVSLWAYATANDLITLYSKMDDGAGHRGFDSLLEGGKISVHLVDRWPDNGLKVLTKKPIAINKWHHILMTYNGSKKAAGVRIYVDGQPLELEITNDKLTGTLKTEKPFHLGRRGASLPFRGKLDDLQVFGVELTPENAKQLAAGKEAELSAGVLAIALAARTPDQRAQLRQLYRQQVDSLFPKWQAELIAISKQKADLEKAFPAVMVMEDLPQKRDTFVLKRGQYDQRGDKVSAGIPAVFASTRPAGTRLDLAKWLVSADHPLTARVAVNRWWHLYFGTGLVKTVEDFGTTGEFPSHPELLDWLATEYVRTGWDTRAMQRLIVTSATYRQSSAVNKALLERDPENRLLARGPRYRLPAETVRDNALAIAGLLVPKVGGPSVKPYQPEGLWEDVTVERRGKYVADTGDGLYRRSMYTFWKRTCPPPGLMTFDAPNREVCVARRATTNTPLQALILLNDPTYVEAARKLAERMIKEGGTSAEGRLDTGFMLAVSRKATAEERRVLLGLLEKSRTRFEADGEAAKRLLRVGSSPADAKIEPRELAAWTAVASVVLNMDETISKR